MIGRALPGFGVIVAMLMLSPAASASDLGAFDARKACSFTDDRLEEISGMAMSLRHPGILWAHNDSSGGPYLYAVDIADCSIRARITVDGIEARDLEAMAIARNSKGKPVIWLADIGDNRSSWSSVRLHRFREPRQLVDQSVTSADFDITFPDRPHDAEALLVAPDSSSIWIVTKQLASGRLYELPGRLSASSPNEATFVRRERGLITDGAMSPDGSRYVLRDYVDATVFTGEPPGMNPVIVQLPYQAQGEAVAWTPTGDGLLIASERDRRLLEVAIASAGKPEKVDVAVESTPTESTPTESTPTESAPTESTPSWALAAVLAAGAVAVVAIAEWRRRASRGG